MLNSPVQLHHYHLSRLDIEPVDGFTPNDRDFYPPFGPDVEFVADVKTSVPTESPDTHEYRISLRLTCRPSSTQVFPYRFEAAAEGFCSVIGEPDPGVRSDLATVNGASMLYSALKDVLLTLTGRFAYGPILLPSVAFLDLRRNGPKISLQTDAAPSAERDAGSTPKLANRGKRKAKNLPSE